MERIYTDVLVIGAGPAGSSAALRVAQNGVDVLMVEQREKIGVPVQCAEFIPAMLLKDLDQGNAFVVQKIKGMQTFIKGRMEKQIHAPGWMIQRDLFDQTLAESAVKSGAVLLTGSKAICFSDHGCVIVNRGNEQKKEIRAKVIIAADGPLSKVRQWINAPALNPLPGVQMSFTLTLPSDYTQVFLDPTVNSGYAWLFPKGDMANVGLGLRNNNSNPVRPFKILNKFISHLKDQGKITGDPLFRSAGWIPAEPLRKAVYGKVLFAGDAAGQTHPITGAGIFSAVTCGSMAGKYAAQAVLEGDPSQLPSYDHEWQDLFKRTHIHAHNRRKLMETQWDKFDRIIRSCWVAFGEYHAG